MSMALDGKTIFCDEAGCTATVDAPVALRQQLNRCLPLAAGWFFVLGNGKPTHFCPSCGRKLLEGIHNGEAVEFSLTS